MTVTNDCDHYPWSLSSVGEPSLGNDTRNLKFVKNSEIWDIIYLGNVTPKPAV